jgi:hypothetical protein
MANEVRIKKTVYNKEQLDKVVDRSFKTFAQPVPEEEAQITVEEFFLAYEDLYFEIPIEGENNSHQYLIQRSSELVDFEKDTQDIQPLLDEIAQLRQLNLDQQQQIIELTGQIAGGTV